MLSSRCRALRLRTPAQDRSAKGGGSSGRKMDGRRMAEAAEPRPASTDHLSATNLSANPRFPDRWSGSRLIVAVALGHLVALAAVDGYLPTKAVDDLEFEQVGPKVLVALMNRVSLGASLELGDEFDRDRQPEAESAIGGIATEAEHSKLVPAMPCPSPGETNLGSLSLVLRQFCRMATGGVRKAQSVTCESIRAMLEENVPRSRQCAESQRMPI